MSKLQPVRGTHDWFPDDNRKFRFISGAARCAAGCYGYGEIQTPIFEFSEVFERTLGDTSDVVNKETYTFTDRGGERITLRPEFTAPTVRAFLSNGLKDQLPLKYFYQGPCFRYERPQKGRLRQFHQFGVELLGVAEPSGDIEVIAMAAQFLSRLQLDKTTRLEINSLGDAESRKKYREALVSYLRAHQAKLSEDSKTRLEKNPLRVLDSKDEGDRKINANAPKISDYFTSAAQEFYAKVKEGLADIGLSFYVNDRLVRGLDYYSHTVFEFTTEALGAQNTVLAGGRYDGLVGMMGGPETPGVGWAAGIERLISLVDFTSLMPPPRRPVVLIPLGDAAEREVLKLAHKLRMKKFYVEVSNRGNMSKRMKRADKLNASCAVVLGDEELAKGVAALRDLDKGTQQDVALVALEITLEPFK